jgi:addiction module RelB/DinJ family antitoxin
MNEKIESGTISISIRLDKEIKKGAEVLFSELGMNMTSAINVFLRRCLMENKIPFEIGLRRPGTIMVPAAREMTFKELRDTVAPIAAKHGVNRMYLFGSRARGDDTQNSDFDFCIDVPKNFDLMDMGGLLYDLKDALKANVDLVCEDEMHKRPNLREEILRDRKIIF